MIHTTEPTSEIKPTHGEQVPPLPHLTGQQAPLLTNRTEKQESRKTLGGPIFALLASLVFFYFTLTSAPKLGSYSLAILMINGVGWVICFVIFLLGFVAWLRQRKEDGV